MRLLKRLRHGATSQCTLGYDRGVVEEVVQSITRPVLFEAFPQGVPADVITMYHVELLRLQVRYALTRGDRRDVGAMCVVAPTTGRKYCRVGPCRWLCFV